MTARSRAVFLSYASQDADAARKICDALRAAGVEVWFDQSELRGGDAWDQKIRKQIKECALFMPVISANTQARREGYFRIEWKLAAQRTYAIAEGTPFLLPLLLDDTPEPEALVPAEFREVQWTRLPKGEVSPEFCARVKSLLGGEGGSVAVSPVRPGPAALPGKSRRTPSRAWRFAAIPFALLLVAAGGIALQKLRNTTRPSAPPTAGTSTPSNPTPPASRAGQLVQQAKAICEQWDFATDRDLRLAERLAKEATDLEPTNGEAWAVASLASSALAIFGYDRTPARYDLLRQHAEHALRLDPKSLTARVAQAFAFRHQGGEAIEEAVRIFRQLSQEAPTDKFVVRNLAATLRNARKFEESLKVFESNAVLLGGDAMSAYNRAMVLYALRRDREADAALDQAIGLRPDYVYAHQRKMWEALAVRADVAAAVATLQAVPPNFLLEDRSTAIAAQVRLWARDSTRCIAALERASEYIGSVYYDGPKRYLAGMAHRVAGRHEAAQLEWRTALQQIDQRLTQEPTNGELRAWRARVLALLGQTDTATAELRVVEQQNGETTNRVSPRTWEIYAALDRRDELLEFFPRAIAAGSRTLLASLRLDPLLDAARADPRFQALIERLAKQPPAAPSPPRSEVSPAKTGSTRGPSSPATSAVPPKSIAVLAFRQHGADPENEYLCEAISDELCNVLGRVPGLKVAASASAFSFKGKRVRPSEMAAQLGVAYLVDGTVQKIGNRVRVRAELIKAADESSVWKSELPDYDVKDMFAVQDEVVGAIARNLEVQLGGSVPAVTGIANSEAYRLYREGRQAWRQRAVPAEAERALNLFQRAVAADPRLGRAYAGIIDVSLYKSVRIDVSPFGQRNSTTLADLGTLAEKALQLEPQSAEAHIARGRVLWHRWRSADAVREFRAAAVLNPNSADAHLHLARVLHAEGRMDEALAAVRRAAELDPLSSRSFDNLSLLLADAGRPGEALAAADRALALQPDSLEALSVRMTALSNLARHDEAAALARSLIRMLAPAISETPGTALRGLVRTLQVFARADLETEARDLFSTTRWNAQTRPFALAAMGRMLEAVEALEPQSASLMTVGHLLYRPEWGAVKDDPRLVRYLQEVGWKEAFDRAQQWRAASPPVRDNTQR